MQSDLWNEKNWDTKPLRAHLHFTSLFLFVCWLQFSFFEVHPFSHPFSHNGTIIESSHILGHDFCQRSES